MYQLNLNGNTGFVAELKKENGRNYFLYNKQIWAVTKCDSNDDVLYLADNGGGTDIYYMFHLTYSEYNADGFPRIQRIFTLAYLKPNSKLKILPCIILKI